MFARKVYGLRNFSLSNLKRVDTANADPPLVDVQHDLGGLFTILIEEPFQDMNDELHRGIIVVQEKHLVKGGLLGLGSVLAS